MVYITYPVLPSCRQITFEEMLAGMENINALRSTESGFTRTYVCEYVPYELQSRRPISDLLCKLQQFNRSYNHLIENPDRRSLYYSFCIPKKSGGLRQIDAPHDELKNALRILKTILSESMLADHHTNAYAYVKDRSPVKAVQKHQRFGSNWFGKFDFHGFFPSTTPDFLERQLETIYPFNQILQSYIGRQELHKALSLCFLDGGLPQGTPISPFLTNVMMIPFDYKLTKALNKLNAGFSSNGVEVSNQFCYTRYCDDLVVSSRVHFNIKLVEKKILDILQELNAPFTLNAEKTHYGSKAGQNWMLGLMYNKDDEITVGYRKKKILKATITSYLLDKQNGKNWSLEDVQAFNGTLVYCRSIEKQTIDHIISSYSNKFNMDLMECIKADLSGNCSPAGSVD